MKAKELAEALNKEGKMTFLSKDEKMLKRDIRELWMQGIINGDKPSHNPLGRTIFKLDEVRFDLRTCTSEILFYIRKRKLK